MVFMRSKCRRKKKILHGVAPWASRKDSSHRRRSEKLKRFTAEKAKGTEKEDLQMSALRYHKAVGTVILGIGDMAKTHSHRRGLRAALGGSAQSKCIVIGGKL